LDPKLAEAPLRYLSSTAVGGTVAEIAPLEVPVNLEAAEYLIFAPAALDPIDVELSCWNKNSRVALGS
jgi:hypothetical protein